MPSETQKILWIIFWILVAAGWSVLSFQWLRKSIEDIQPQTMGKKDALKGLIFRRVGVFLSIGLLFYLALRTEPLAAIGMAIMITVMTWVQVILYNVRLNREQSQKEKDLGSN